MTRTSLTLALALVPLLACTDDPEIQISDDDPDVAATDATDSGGADGVIYGFLPSASQIVAVRAPNGNYVSSAGAVSGAGAGVYANRTGIGAWEKFLVLRQPNGAYAIMCQGDSSDRTYYVTAEGGGNGDVRCNRTSIGAWETFSVVAAGGGLYAFRTASGHYLRAQNGGGAGVDARGTGVGPWEKYRFVQVTWPTAGVDQCPGAVGSNCDGVPVAAPCRDENGARKCYVSVGAQLHDSCCSNHPNGKRCGGNGTDSACSVEWDHAQNDTAAARQWVLSFNASGGWQKPYIRAYSRKSGGQSIGMPTSETMFPPKGQKIWCGDAPAFCRAGYDTKLGECYCR